MPPAITARSQPACFKVRIILPSSPTRIHVHEVTSPSSSGSVSPRCATATTSTPASRAPRATRRGKIPLPAISPRRATTTDISGPRHAALAGGREGGQRLRERRVGELAADPLDRVARQQLALEQQTV